MTPWQKAKQWWDEHSDMPFAEAIMLHAGRGMVWSCDNFFMLATQCCWNAWEKRFEDGKPNCWFVSLAASAGGFSPLAQAMRLLPHAQKYMAWRRRMEPSPRIYDWDKLLSKVKGK